MAELTTEELAGVAEVMAAAGAPPVAPLEAELIAGGRSNLTFRLSDGAKRWVLRTAPRAGRTPSAHDVAREYRVTRALSGLVPVPPPTALCEDETVLGAPFAIAQFVDGHCLQTRDELDQLPDDVVFACVTRLVETLAAIHAVDPAAVNLEGHGRPDGYAARQVRRWTSQWDLVGTPTLAPLATSTGRLLAEAVPDQRAFGIVHGDYRIDNTILHLPERGDRQSRDVFREVSVAAVVDWELSTLGDPVADVALMCVYRNPALDLVLGSPSAWTSARLPDVDGLAAAYERAGGVPLSDWEFHLALGHFKLAVIAAGIDHRYRVGATHGPGFDTAGEAVAPLLEMAREHVRAVV